MLTQLRQRIVEETKRLVVFFTLFSRPRQFYKFAGALYMR
jgi:hypothetical protein